MLNFNRSLISPFFFLLSAISTISCCFRSSITLSAVVSDTLGYISDSIDSASMIFAHSFLVRASFEGLSFLSPDFRLELSECSGLSSSIIDRTTLLDSVSGNSILFIL